ncbi:hypothetical protein M231_03608 [Tremella mesenterica]|uniref:Nitroreductase domain-containing protein n=1 Tax=Tremella mesenterica TaxID=5217 RepID=A0A4Q1BMP6_TREME|nr:uncharacterized protein TREMEDRAFT_37268 [Tremella mesenterica DSM 1558]EIW73289.1 hypothetical protein TREMEDRAFT_37268 [Tremella mesenterica DSM 1558]RXK39103.1 hypothetical protein M231_03608 [Tremella mesenterica]
MPSLASQLKKTLHMGENKAEASAKLPIPTPVSAATQEPKNPSGSAAFFDAVENRRSYYGIKAESPLTDEQLVALVGRAVKHAPNSFNMQQSRAVVLTGKAHAELWEKVLETNLKGLGGDKDQEEQARGRVNGAFKTGYGTVAFFEDMDVVKAWGEKMPFVAEAFVQWSDVATGILQYIVWTALEKEGLGASLQHYAQYSQETQDAITELCKVPAAWRCTALLPFGVPIGPPGNPAHPKDFQPLEERVKLISA